LIYKYFIILNAIVMYIVAKCKVALEEKYSHLQFDIHM